MGSGKGGGGGSKSYDYFGTIAGAVALGPVTLHSVIYDGKEIWSGTAAPSGDTPTNLTGSIDPKFFLRSTSYFKFYHGTAGQTIDAALATNHPNYNGVAYFVAKGLLFGREKTTAPNLEFVVRRRPVVSTDVIGADQADLDAGGQANPVAALAELLTARHGAGVDAARLDADSWQAAAEYAEASSARCYVSAFAAEAKELRRVASELLAMVDGVLYWTPEGLLGLRLVKPGVEPDDAVSITRAMMAAPPKWKSGTWGDVPTAAIVKYFDRERKFKGSDEFARNLVSLRVRGEEESKDFDLPHVTRRAQAAEWAAEFMRRSVHPPVTVDLDVRAETVPGVGPGSKVLVNITPESNTEEVSEVLAVVTERRDDPEGPARLVLTVDPLAEVAIYTPGNEPPTETEVEVAELENALVIPLPVSEWETPSVGVLATRSQAVQTGFDFFFAWDTDGDSSLADEDYSPIGRQTGFACRLTLDEALDADETAADFTLTDGAAGLDAYLAALADEVSGAVAANDDPVLIVLANVDIDGRVSVSGGVAEMEFLSVVTRTAIDSDSHTYTVFRGRKGTTARAWTTAAQAWILPALNLDAWTHPDIRELVESGDTGFAKLFAVAAFGESPAGFVREFVMPSAANQAPRVSWTTPATSLALTDPAGDVVPDFSVTDANGDLVALRVDSVKSDGTGATNHANETFAATSSRPWSQTLNFGVGAFYLTVTATDGAGSVTRSTRVVQNDNAGADLTVPEMDPPGGVSFLYSLDVDIAVAGAADRYEYVVAAPGSAAPGGSGTLVVATTGTVSLSTSRRLWVRAGDGGTWSAWISGDFTRTT